MSLVQHLGDDRAEQRVAEKLQPFVVRFADAAVGQRQHRQRRIAEAIGELQGTHWPTLPCNGTLLLKCSRKSMLYMNGICLS